MVSTYEMGNLTYFLGDGEWKQLLPLMDLFSSAQVSRKLLMTEADLERAETKTEGSEQ